MVLELSDDLLGERVVVSKALDCGVLKRLRRGLGGAGVLEEGRG